jgi:hypothetical protein
VPLAEGREELSAHLWVGIRELDYAKNRRRFDGHVKRPIWHRIDVERAGPPGRGKRKRLSDCAPLGDGVVPMHGAG